MLKSSIKKQWSLAPLLFLCLSLMLTACGKIGPYVEPAEPDPLPEGPGLFSGEKGHFAYGAKSNDSDADSDTGRQSDPAEFEEFEAYQRWQTEERHSDEYREFKQWLEFKKWKSQQDKQ